MSKNQNKNRISVTSLDYYTIIKDLLHNIWVVFLAGAIAFMGVSLVMQLIHKPQYTSSATLMVAGSANNYNSFATYASDAERFAGILTDSYVLQEVAESMGLDRLDAQVEASVIAETNLLNLNVTASSPTMAFQTARGILDHYGEISSLMYPNYSLMELVPVSYPSGVSNYIEADSLRNKCVALAMLAMALLIAICSCLYDNIKNYKDAEEKLDTDVYGVVYHEQKVKSGPLNFGKKNKKSILVTDKVVSSSFIEAYKHLRERIIARTRESGKKVILVTSMLENEGKSTVAANLALSLAAVSDKVLLIDGDLRKPAQFKVFDVEKFVDYSNYLSKKEPLEACIYQSEHRGLNLLLEREGGSNSTEIIDTPAMEELIRIMREQMDYIIIDTPPMAQVSDAEAIAKYADYSLLVLAPDNSKTDLINDCIADLEACNATLLGCVLNNVHTVSRWIYQHLHIDVSRMVSTNTNDYISGYGYGYGSYGYGDSDKKRRSSQKASSVAHYTESADEFFVYPKEELMQGEEEEDE